MSFTYPLPDPESNVLTDVVGPDGTIETGMAPEMAAAIDSVIQAQTDAITAVLQQLAVMVQGQLAAQAQMLATTWQGIAPIIETQLRGQQAALTVLTQQISDNITRRIARQTEMVGTVAVGAALLPRPPGVYPGSNPTVPQPIPVTRPWPPGTSPVMPWPTPQPGPMIPAPGEPTTPQTPPRPGTPGQDVTIPGMPTVPTEPEGTIPLEHVPQLGVIGGQTVTSPGEPVPPGGVPSPQTPPPPEGGLPGEPAQTPQSFAQAMQQGAPSAGTPPGTTQGQGLPPTLFPPAPGTPLGQVMGVDVGTTTQTQAATSSSAAPGEPTINVIVNVDAKGGDAYSTATSNVDLVNKVDGPTINVSPEDDQRETNRQVNVANEDEERLRRIFNQAAPAAGDRAEPKPECPWQLGMRIPPIGGREWCQQQFAIMKGLAAVGLQVMTFVQDYVDGLSELALDIRANANTPNLNAAGKWIADAINTLLKPTREAWKMVRQIIACWRAVSGVIPSCDPGTVLGLAVFRGLVKWLERLHGGINAGVVLTVNLKLELKPIEAALDYLINAMCPSRIPDAKSAYAAYVAGMISEAEWRCWTLCAGEDPDLWFPVRLATGHALQAHDLILHARLEDADLAEVDRELFKRGWTRAADRTMVQELYDRVPTGEQWIQWRFLGAQDNEVAKAFGTDEGFGEFWLGVPGDNAKAHGMREVEGRQRWRAGRPLPTLAELQQYYWRLRPGGAHGTWQVDRTTVEKLLKAQGWTSVAVEWAMATINRPLHPADAALLDRMGMAGQQDIRDAYLDGGYEITTAGQVALAAGYDAQRVRSLQEGGWSIPVAVAARQIGLKAPAAMTASLASQGLGDPEVRTATHIAAIMGRASIRRRGRMQATSAAVRAALDAYATGLVSAGAAVTTMVNAGYDAASAVTLTAAQNLRARVKRANRAIRALEKGVLGGEITGLAAAVILAQMGITPERTDELVKSWAIDQAATRPMAHVGEIRRWVGQGLLPLKAARQRLLNMGWKDPDLTLMLSEMGQRLARAQAQAQQKGAAAAAAAAKAASAVRTQALRRLMRLQPVAAIGQWYRDGVMTQHEATARLLKYGYDQHSITLYLQGWDYQVHQANRSTRSGKPGALLPAQKQVPLSRVRTWFIQGIVDEQWARDRLTGYGYDHATTERYLAEWQGERTSKAARQAKAPPA